MVATETVTPLIARVVLVVDGCPDTGAAVGSVVSAAFGAFAVNVQDAADATRWLGKVRPNAALVCLALEGGLALIERMRVELPMADVPIIAMGAPSDRESALAAGCAAFLRKPLSADAIVETLRPLL